MHLAGVRCPVTTVSIGVVFNVSDWVWRNCDEREYLTFHIHVGGVPGDQRNSGDCPGLDLRGEQWRRPNSLLESVKNSTCSTASKENGKECGVRHGMLPRASGITNAREHSSWVRRSVRGNGRCFNPRVGVFVCLTPMSPDVLRGWVPKTVSSPEWAESVAVSRPWEWPKLVTGSPFYKILRIWLLRWTGKV